MIDFYRVLSVERSASQEAIQHRYRYLVTVYHPDRFSQPEHKRQAEEDMKRINQAYAVLSNPEARARYDRGEAQFEPSPSSAGAKPTSRARSQQQRIQAARKKPSAEDSMLGVGAILVFTSTFALLVWVVSVYLGGMSPLRFVLVILLSVVLSMPVVFRLDDTLRRRK
jgi:hypothetical protein